MVDLPAPDNPVNQTIARRLPLQRGALGLADGQGLPIDIGGTAQGESDHAGRDGPVGVSIDHDERPGLVVLLVGVEGHRDGHGNIAKAISFRPSVCATWLRVFMSMRCLIAVMLAETIRVPMRSR